MLTQVSSLLLEVNPKILNLSMQVITPSPQLINWIGLFHLANLKFIPTNPTLTTHDHLLATLISSPSHF